MIQPVVWPRKGKRRQQPPRISWLIWVTLYLVMFWASFAARARGSLWIVGAEVVGCSTLFAVALRWGSGSLLLVRVSLRPGLRVTVASWPDLLVLLGAAVALAGWQLTSSAALGVVLSVVVDCIAAVPLIGAVWRAPWTGSRLGWASTGLASAAAIFSVAPGSGLALHAYPVAGVALDAVVITVLLAAYDRAGRAASVRASAEPAAGSATGYDECSPRTTLRLSPGSALGLQLLHLPAQPLRLLALISSSGRPGAGSRRGPPAGPTFEPTRRTPRARARPRRRSGRYAPRPRLASELRRMRGHASRHMDILCTSVQVSTKPGELHHRRWPVTLALPTLTS